jgi:hypothetical protein
MYGSPLLLFYNKYYCFCILNGCYSPGVEYLINTPVLNRPGAR